MSPSPPASGGDTSSPYGSVGARPPHVVLLREPARFDAPSVAAVLAGRSKIDAQSWLPVVRRSWGILAEPSAAEDAESLAAALTAAGRAALAVPVGLLEEPAPPVTVTKGELAGDGFDIIAGKVNAQRERLNWAHMSVLSAGAVSSTDLKTVTEGPSVAEKSARLALTMTTGLPLLGGKGKTRRVVEERRVPYIDMLFVAPARRVRILAADFDYAALGDKMSYSAELNFRALVSALAAAAPGALRSRGARGVLAKSPSGELAYESFEDVSREERWLLALVSLKAAL
ncbi:MAG: hypothetical protein HY923_11490 [Elusimicrobia bacterium]|nr:hypothetical protein [Elusimicrobiota bacterium]